MRQYGKLRYVSNNTMITPVVVSVSIRPDVHLRPSAFPRPQFLHYHSRCSHRFRQSSTSTSSSSSSSTLSSPVSFSRPLPPRQSSRSSRTCVCIFRDAKIDTEPCVTVAEFHGRGLRFGRCFDRSQCGLPTPVDNPLRRFCRFCGSFCPHDRSSWEFLLLVYIISSFSTSVNKICTFWLIKSVFESLFQADPKEENFGDGEILEGIEQRTKILSRNKLDDSCFSEGDRIDIQTASPGESLERG